MFTTWSAAETARTAPGPCMNPQSGRGKRCNTLAPNAATVLVDKHRFSRVGDEAFRQRVSRAACRREIAQT